MNPQNDFWLAVHRFTAAYEAEGQTPAQREAKIVERFLGMSAIAQRELIADLFTITVHVPELFTAVKAAACDGEKTKQASAPSTCDG
jgi:hypothetical protein